MTLPFTGGMNCLCTEQWMQMPDCGDPPSYGYVLLVHPDCTRHVRSLAQMQEMIKEMRGDGLD